MAVFSSSRAAKFRMSLQMTVSWPISASSAAASCASRPSGARISARARSKSRVIGVRLHQRIGGCHEIRHAAQHTLELLQRRAKLKLGTADPVFADGILVRLRAFIDEQDRAAHLTQRLEVAQQHHGIGQGGDVVRRLHVAHQARCATVRNVEVPWRFRNCSSS